MRTNMWTKASQRMADVIDRQRRESEPSMRELAHACLTGEINDPDYDASAFEKMAEDEVRQGHA